MVQAAARGKQQLQLMQRLHCMHREQQKYGQWQVGSYVANPQTSRYKGAMSLSRDDEQKMRVSAVLVLLAIAGANIASAQTVSQGTLCHIILPTITAV